VQASDDKVKRETRERIIPRVAALGDDKVEPPIRGARTDTCGQISRLNHSKEARSAVNQVTLGPDAEPRVRR
jgi:hypothetical protein